MPGTLTIRPLSAKLTRDTEFFGQMDPYCKITFGKQKVQGSVCKNGGKYPHWDDALILRRTNEPDLEIEIKEKDWLLPDGTIGFCRLNLREVESQRRVLKWFPVSYEHKSAGQILIEATYEADHSIPRNLSAQQAVVHPQDIPHILPYQEPEYSADKIRGERAGHHESSQPAGYGGDIHGWNPFNPNNYPQPQPTSNQELRNEYYQPQGNQGQYQPSSNDNSQKYPMFSSQENQRFYENQQSAGNYENYQGNQGNQVIDYRDNVNVNTNINANANAPQQNYNYDAPQHLYTNEPLSEQHHQTSQRENQDQLDPIHQMIRGAYYKGHH